MAIPGGWGGCRGRGRQLPGAGRAGPLQHGGGWRQGRRRGGDTDCHGWQRHWQETQAPGPAPPAPCHASAGAGCMPWAGPSFSGCGSRCSGRGCRACDRGGGKLLPGLSRALLPVCSASKPDPPARRRAWPHLAGSVRLRLLLPEAARLLVQRCPSGSLMLLRLQTERLLCHTVPAH